MQPQLQIPSVLSPQKFLYLSFLIAKISCLKVGEFLPLNTDEIRGKAELHGDTTAHQLKDLNVFQVCIQRLKILADQDAL